jgi:hypothetical protein
MYVTRKKSMQYLQYIFVFPLFLLCVPAAAQSQDTASQLLRGHEEWFACESDDQCISVDIAGKLKTTGQSTCDRPVINKDYIWQYNKFLSETLQARGSCSIEWPSVPKIKCIDNICGRQICNKSDGCHFYTYMK